MKRSTLTLSILTALLVSACGGSSSNDEQTKDPTPPKVTPTKPTPPSSGQTPTTGNTGNAGTSGSSAGSSSSSSSDPTPPISSGSAPSGGKPIVITSETKEKEKDKDKDKEPKDDPIKTLEAQLAKAKEDLIKSGVAVGDAKADLEGFKPHKTDPTKTVASRAWQKQDNLRKGFFSSHEKLGLPENTTANKATIKKIGLKSIETALENNKSKFSAEEFLKLETNLQAYKEAREKWLNDNQEVYTKIETLYNAEKQASEDKKKFDSLAAELRKKTADPIKAEADFYDKQMKLIEQQYQQSQKAAELKKIEEELDQKGTDGRDLVDLQNDLMYARDDLKSKDPNIATELANIKKRIEANKAEQATLTSGQKRLTNEKTPLDNRITELKKDVEKAKEIAGNRGVSAIGTAGLSKDNFLQIQSAELVKDVSNNPQTWKLTFLDGSSRDIDVRTSGGDLSNNKIQFGASNTVYGYFKTTAASNTANASAIAFRNSRDTDPQSIYGYIDDRFYSVGKVAEPKVVDGLKNSYLTYSGKALLQAEQQGLIADVGGHVYGGEFKGKFENFATYDRASTGGTVTATAVGSLTDDNLKALKEALANPVPFSASVQGNKFMTKSPNDGEASVYGYFYGSETEVKEAGGLVQLKDVFHGSFGGEVKEK